MRNVESLVNVVGRWQPADVAYIRSLYYQAQQTGNPAELQLECILERRDTAKQGWPSQSNRRFKADFRFTGVTDLSIKEFGCGDTQIMGFDVVDLSERGWEGVRYEVQDYENGRIHFLCANIEVINVVAL